MAFGPVLTTFAGRCETGSHIGKRRLLPVADSSLCTTGVTNKKNTAVGDDRVLLQESSIPCSRRGERGGVLETTSIGCAVIFWLPKQPLFCTNSIDAWKPAQL